MFAWLGLSCCGDVDVKTPMRHRKGAGNEQECSPCATNKPSAGVNPGAARATHRGWTCDRCEASPIRGVSYINFSGVRDEDAPRSPSRRGGDEDDVDMMYALCAACYAKVDDSAKDFVACVAVLVVRPACCMLQCKKGRGVCCNGSVCVCVPVPVCGWVGGHTGERNSESWTRRHFHTGSHTPPHHMLFLPSLHPSFSCSLAISPPPSLSLSLSLSLAPLSLHTCAAVRRKRNRC